MVEQDPIFQQISKEYELAFREHRRALRELRKFYLSKYSNDLGRAAQLQQIAHDAEQRMTEVKEEWSRFAWEIVPHSTNTEHLKKIEELKKQALERASKDVPQESYKSASITTVIHGTHKIRVY